MVHDAVVIVSSTGKDRRSYLAINRDRIPILITDQLNTFIGPQIFSLYQNPPCFPAAPSYLSSRDIIFYRFVFGGKAPRTDPAAATTQPHHDDHHLPIVSSSTTSHLDLHEINSAARRRRRRRNDLTAHLSSSALSSSSKLCYCMSHTSVLVSLSIVIHAA